MTKKEIKKLLCIDRLLIFLLFYCLTLVTSCNNSAKEQNEKGLITKNNKTMQNDKSTFVGRAVMVNGIAKFVWDLSVSESFYLEGLEFWEKKYLNRMIKIEGKLTKRYNHGIYAGQVIEDWEIIEPK